MTGRCDNVPGVRRAASLLLGLTALTSCVPDSRPGEPAGAPSAKPVNRPTLRPAASVRSPTGVPPGGAARRLPPSGGEPATDPLLTAEFTDTFDRPAVGPDWNVTSTAWRIQNGRLCVSGARNHPAWLRRRLPVNARIEFDAAGASPQGDIKAEFWGDGRSAAEAVSYTTATSYLTIFGGWKNSFHVLARINEHAPDRPEIALTDDPDDLRAHKVEANRTYRFKVVRDDGKTVRWFVDDLEILSFTDPSPLSGPGHDHFGFNDWEVPVCFDNLVVTPLP